MIKKILIIFCLVFSLYANAQNASSSPYSYYGLGDFVFKGNIENRAMGGINMIKDSIHININNSASLSDIMNTTFTIGGNYNYTKFLTEQQSESASRASIDYVAIAIPISKRFVAAFGAMPFTSVGYKIQTDNTTDESIPISRFTGSGGINKVYGGLGFKINEHFQVGADMNFNFGNVSTNNITFLSGVQYGTRELNTSEITGFNFNTSLMYSRLIYKKTTIFGTLLYSPETTLNAANERSIAVIQLTDNFGEIVINEEDIDVGDSKIKYPSKIGFGVGVGEVRKWSVGAEVTFINNSDQGNRFNDIDDVNYENVTKYNFGGYFLPDYNSFSSYYKRITYRAGFNYQNTGLILNNKSLDNYGITFGLGLPIKGSFSNVNIAYEYGRRGTIYGGLIQENFQNISISFSLNDKWFIKRKYD
jgi:long-subunit fatty acid transport protein